MPVNGIETIGITPGGTVSVRWVVSCVVGAGGDSEYNNLALTTNWLLLVLPVLQVVHHIAN